MKEDKIIVIMKFLTIIRYLVNVKEELSITQKYLTHTYTWFMNQRPKNPGNIKIIHLKYLQLYCFISRNIIYDDLSKRNYRILC